MLIFFLLLGLIIGSFLNVVALRLESGKTLGGRSQCPSCGTLIRWYDNIPVLSYFLLGRQCRQCHAPIAWQYPVVESVTGILFAVFGTLAFGTGTEAEIAATLWQLTLVALLVVIALYDVRNLEIPLILLVMGLGGAALYALVATWLAPLPWTSAAAPWKDMFWGGAVTAAVLYALVYFSRETWMGMGDVWLGGMAGAAVGLPAVLLLFTLSFCVGAVVGVGLMVVGKRGMQSQIPFAPFLAFGTLATLFIQALDPGWLSLLLFPPI